jgi:recombination protein RecR
MQYPKAIQNLIDKLSEFPSVGPKTAERYVFYLLRQSTEKIKNLGQAINELKENTIICQKCLAISESNPCSICSDESRDKILCVVENTQDFLAIEATKQYNGLYFILDGLLNTIHNIQPEDLNINKLVQKIKTEKITEIILALNFTLEGETTALYLSKILKDHIKITRLAKGLPAGSDLEYADGTTLSSALKNRNEV